MDNTAKRLILDANMSILKAQQTTFNELRAQGDLAGALEQAKKMLGTATVTLESSLDLLADLVKETKR